MGAYNSLQLRELFHLEFLRWLGRKLKPQHYCLKGGVNLRFFFKSIRYSEDMDLDACNIRKDVLLEAVMQILKSSSFQNTFKPFGIENVVPPNITKAKQTETTQRFKVHLITSVGEDLFTKIEFSRRRVGGDITVESVAESILRQYMLAPLLVPHYPIQVMITQKVTALITRKVPQARDIFDLYILSSQYNQIKAKPIKIENSTIRKANERIFEIGFLRFRDTVISYLPLEDQAIYNNADIWDEIKLRVSNFLEGLT